MQKPIVGFGAVGGLKAADRIRPGKARASETLAKLIAGMGKMRFMQMAAAVGSEVHRHDPMFRERRVLDRSEDLAGEPDAIMAPANWAKRKLAPKVPARQSPRSTAARRFCKLAAPSSRAISSVERVEASANVSNPFGLQDVAGIRRAISKRGFGTDLTQKGFNASLVAHHEVASPG